MPRYHKRYNRRNRRLAKSNILTNRSAKAQSKQIAALSRKVNVLAKASKPEIRNIWVKYNHDFTNSSLNQSFHGTAIHPWLGTYAGSDQASDTYELEGNFCRAKGLSVKIVTQYNEFQNAEIGSSTIENTEPYDVCAGYRIVILQEKQGNSPDGSTSSLTYDNVFATSSSVSTDEYNLVCPLVTGITARFKVLYCKSFTVNTYRPTRYHNIYIPAKRLINFTRQVSTSSTYSQTCKGKIWVCMITAGLHYDSTYGSKIQVKGCYKLAFTDN